MYQTSKGITKEDVLTFLNDIRSRKEFNQLSYGRNTDVQTYASQFYNYMDLKYLLKTLQIIIPIQKIIYQLANWYR